MNVTMRFYRRHDVDLLLLHKTDGFSLKDAIKEAVLMHFGLMDEKRIPYPSASKPVKDFNSITMIHLLLHEDVESDMAIIKILKDIPIGYRNSFLKNLVRYHLDMPKQFMYYDDKIFFGKGEQHGDDI